MRLELDDERRPRPLTPPDFRFTVRFRCNDRACRGVHNFSVLDWEIDALYFGLRQRAVSRHTRLLGRRSRNSRRSAIPKKDTRFFLGNISTHPHKFTIVGFWWPNKPPLSTEPLLIEGRRRPHDMNST